jgi:hypothetical protein
MAGGSETRDVEFQRCFCGERSNLGDIARTLASAKTFARSFELHRALAGSRTITQARTPHSRTCVGYWRARQQANL